MANHEPRIRTAPPIQIQTTTKYHIEYYQPLTRAAEKRDFTFQCPGDYAVDDISVSIRIPPNTSDIVTDPNMKPTNAADGSSTLVKDFGALQAGQRFPLHLTYSRTSDALTVPGETVQPSKPLGSNTPGRVLLAKIRSSGRKSIQAYRRFSAKPTQVRWMYPCIRVPSGFGGNTGAISDNICADQVHVQVAPTLGTVTTALRIASQPSM